jgi:hypothetical protein
MALYRKATPDDLLKKEAVAQNLGSAEKLSTINDIVDNTVKLFHAFKSCQ